MDFSIATLFGVAEDASIWTNFISVVWRVILVILGVNLLVIVHEFGHFIVARMCGVRCDKFYIWFDAYGFKLFSFKRGDTEYGLGWLPLGGYVKMLGQEDNPSGIQAEIERAKTDNAENESLLSEEEKKERENKLKELEQQLYAPDSYLAKNVFQRMAIISAGVVMNIIFAIICAAGASLIGTPETSAKVGYVSPGSPAWNAGLQAGDEIVSIGDNEKPVFSSILVACMDRKELEFKVRRPGTLDIETFRITPRVDKGGLTPMIGVGPSRSLQLLETDDQKPFMLSFDENESQKLLDELALLEGNEQLVRMNNHPVSTRADYLRLNNLFIDRPIEYVFAPTVKMRGGVRVIDESKDTVSVTLQPRRLPDIGVRLTMGEILEVRAGSVAEKVGLVPRKVDENGVIVQHGDVILEIDNKPILDPMSLSYKLFDLSGRDSFDTRSIKDTAGDLIGEKAEGIGDVSSYRTITLTVNREGNRVELPVTLPRFAPYGGLIEHRGVMASEVLGIAYQIKPIVSGVDGSVTLSKSPFGGRVLEIKAQITNPGSSASEFLRSSFKELTGKDVNKFKKGELVEFTRKFNPSDNDSNEVVSFFTNILPLLPNGTNVVATIECLDGEMTTIESKVKRDGETFAVTRGLIFDVDAVYQRADSLSEALSFGVSKTVEAASQVFVFLKNVGKNVSAKALGGPGLIVGTAYQAAGRNDGVFLLFLCLISANLAVVNFLPIPVLDGGHMVFLLYEAVTKRKPNEKIQIVLSYVGLILILTLMGWVIFLDIMRYCF